MNFKSTAVLLVLLIAVGGYVLFTRNKGPAVPATPAVHTVLDVTAADVTAVTVAAGDGKPTVAMEKIDGNWRLTQPVRAAADSYKASSLVDDLTTNLKSTNVVKATGGDAPKTGVDHPQYTVDLTAGGRTAKLAVGDRLAVGDGVYAQVAGQDSVDVVPATLLDTLAKPASDLRKTQLFDNVTTADVKQLTLTHKDGSKLELQKAGGAWKVVAPQPMPADTSAVEDVLATVINLTPVSFVDDPADAVGLNRPQAVVAFSTASPTTAPTTGPVPMVVKLGGYDDVQKKNVFASLSDGTMVKVAASVLDTLNKSALDLRDKSVLDVDPATVTKVTIATDTAATTQPTTQPAASKTVVLTRRPPKPVVMGPSTKPTTAATTAPTTVWTLDGGADADDAKVASLLGQFHPLKADKYLTASAVANPARRFTVTLTRGSNPPVVVRIDDPGHDLSLIGTADGLTFNLPTTLATDLTAEFKK